MTPAARAAAAIAILDQVLDGAPAEKALTNWARGARYAGSGDRNAVRDLVFDCLRCKRSFAWIGRAETGRGLVLGAAHERGEMLRLFDGSQYGPPVLSDAERMPRDLSDAPEAVRLDVPDWLLPVLRESLVESELAENNFAHGPRKSNAAGFMR